MSTTRQMRTAAAAGVVLAVVIAAVTVALTDSTAPVKLADGSRPVSAPMAPVAGAPGTSGAPAAAPSQRRPAAWRTPRAATPSASSPAPGPTGAASATRTGMAGTPPTPSPTTARPTPSAARSPSAGTLIVNLPGGQLPVTAFGATITLTAQGGPVDWSVTVSGGSGRVIIQPSSGTLKAGRSVTVTILASHRAAGRRLTVRPGGTVFTIVTGWGDRLVTGGPPNALVGAMLPPARARRGRCKSRGGYAARQDR